MAANDSTEEEEMAKLLVLIRHGKAQSRDLGLVDFERELTGAGKRALKAWLPKSGQLLAGEEAQSFELWASPAARTMQTGEAVAKTWGKYLPDFPKRPEPVDALWNGDMDTLLEAFDESASDAVVICGHNPYIEMLCADLSGCDIRFATGGIAALRVEDASGHGAERDEWLAEPRARLLWFVQGPESRKWKKNAR